MDGDLPIARFETIYSSVSANRHESNISHHKGLLLYSRCHCPIVYDLLGKRIRHTLIGHKAEVNGQSFITNLGQHDDDNYIISTSYDKTAIIWKLKDQGGANIPCLNTCLFTLKSPDDNAFISRCAFRDESCIISVTTTMNSSIYLWKDGCLTQTINTNYYCFHARFYIIHLGETKLILLFLSCSDNKVHVFQLVDRERLNPLLELAGHSDWIKCVDILDLPGKREFLLASASQDLFIRVWHMKLIDHDLDSRHIRTTVSQPLESQEPRLRLTATLETVLMSHESIVHGLCWFKKISAPTLQLVSCSGDKTLIIWKSSTASKKQSDLEQQANQSDFEQNPASAEIWKVTHKIGETGETNLPFLGVCLSDDETILYAQSLKGAIHSWKLTEGGQWCPHEAITGHFEPVTDLSWERSGAYLLSTSLDKTCRLHAKSSGDGKWHELARPQVHGHELNCVVSIDFCKFATGAEEKTVRLYGATQFFINNFGYLSNDVAEVVKLTYKDLPKHGRLPALGLSIRGAACPYDIEEDNTDFSSASAWYQRSELSEKLAAMEHLDSLPTEEILLQSTLWYETSVLIGHGNELQALATDSKGQYLASSSRAKRSDTTNFIIWSCAHARKSATIDHHSLTITRLRFSPDDRYILTVSRDRTWCLSEQTGKLRPSHKKLIGTTESDCIHKRIIWDCCWTSDSEYFVTVSRDKKAVVWSISALRAKIEPSTEQVVGKIEPEFVKEYHCSIQAVDSPTCTYADKQYIVALGFEDGSLDIGRLSMQPSIAAESRWQLLVSIKTLHHLPVRRISFRPATTKDQKRNLILASGGDDCIVKLTKIDLS